MTFLLFFPELLLSEDNLSSILSSNFCPEFQVGKELMQMKREAERENNFQV
jgi:hypothetical protein